MDKKNISVIITVFNAAETLDEAIQSVLDQTLLPAKIIITNDASTDDTGLKLKAWQKKYPNIFEIITHQTNQGVSTSRNHALEKVQTKYVAVLDGDDVWPAERLEKMLSHVKKTNGYAAVSDGYFMNKQGEVDQSQTIFETRAIQPPGNQLTAEYLIRYLCPQCFYLAETEKVREVRYNDSLPVTEDMELLAGLIHRFGSIEFMPEPLVHYRLANETSLSSDQAQIAWYHARFLGRQIARVHDLQSKVLGLVHLLAKALQSLHYRWPGIFPDVSWLKSRR